MCQDLEMVPMQRKASDFVLVGFWYQNQKLLNIGLTLVRAKQKNDLYSPVGGFVISGGSSLLVVTLQGHHFVAKA